MNSVAGVHRRSSDRFAAPKLVEEDKVFLAAGPLGTAMNSAIWRYMNEHKVPQLFVGTGATKWDDPQGHPWTIGWQPNYQSEGRIYAAYILKERPDGKIGVLYQAARCRLCGSPCDTSPRLGCNVFE